jgi:hypothetical protein
MAYIEEQATRIRDHFDHKNISFTEKTMFSGICFMVDDKLCCCTHTDKKTGEQMLLCRVGEEAYEAALEQNYCTPMDFTGRSMKGYVYVSEDGWRSSKTLDYWLQLCINYNPFAKRSKK